MHQSGVGVYVHVCIYGSCCFLYGYNVSPDINILVLSQSKPMNSHLCNLIYCFIFLSSSFFHFFVCISDISVSLNEQNTVTKPTIRGMSLIPTCHLESNGQEWYHCIHTDTHYKPLVSHTWHGVKRQHYNNVSVRDVLHFQWRLSPQCWSCLSHIYQLPRNLCLRIGLWENCVHPILNESFLTSFALN